MSETKTTQVQVKAVTDDSVTIAGYGVVFGGADLYGETFTDGTDFMLDLVPEKLVLYDHGMDSTIKQFALGHIKNASIVPDEFGLWIEAQLDRSHEYTEWVRELAERATLGWSSGSIGHLVNREGKNIKRWPIVEFSLTPTPAEPRTLGAEVLKALADTHQALEQLSTEGDEAGEETPGAAPVDIESKSMEGETEKPEDARKASAPVPEAPADSTVIVNVNIAQEETIVSEETKTVETVEPAQDNSAVLEAIGQLADSMKGMADRIEAIENEPAESVGIQVEEVKSAEAPAIVSSLGDSETKAFAHWLKTGDDGGIQALKASNDTDMNVGTNADGGYAVPTGHYNGIIASLHETALYPQLGVMEIPGVGTTVNVPLDNEADGEFVSTAEAASTDRDAPALGTKAMTLVKYTKRIELSSELLEDEDSRLMQFIEQWVGSGMSKTHNSLLTTEALANGTAALTLDGAAAITAAEIPELLYTLKGEYEGNSAWVMKRATEGYIRGLTGNNFQFVPTPQGMAGIQRELYGLPVYNSEYMPAIATGNKTLLVGNFRYMGMRQAPSITFLRDPFSKASSGQVVLHYYFRTVYGVLQAEAIRYATQA